MSPPARRGALGRAPHSTRHDAVQTVPRARPRWRTRAPGALSSEVPWPFDPPPGQRPRRRAPTPGGREATRNPPSGRCRRSSCARCATARSSRSIAATSSRSTPRDGCCTCIGDPDRIVNLRSAMKPFGLVALLRGRGPPRVRPHGRGARDDDVQPLGRGRPRPDDPGAVPPPGDPAVACWRAARRGCPSTR